MAMCLSQVLCCLSHEPIRTEMYVICGVSNLIKPFTGIASLIVC